MKILFPEQFVPNKSCFTCNGEGRYKTGWDCIACSGTGQARLILCSRIDHRDVQFEMAYGCWKCAEEREEQEVA